MGRCTARDPDHHAQVARALYSLRTRFVGKTPDVRADTRMVCASTLGAELVKIQTRIAPGRRSIDPHDLPIEKADYALRGVDGVKRRAGFDPATGLEAGSVSLAKQPVA